MQSPAIPHPSASEQSRSWFSCSPSDLRFRNNIFITATSGNFTENVSEDQDFVFQANCYWSSDGKFSLFGKYRSLEEWANASGQERINGRIVGVFADPQITYWQGNEPRPTDPARMTQMTAFLLKATSPCVDTGLDLKTQFRMDPGTRDFFGHPIPSGPIDIGACEFQKSKR